MGTGDIMPSVNGKRFRCECGGNVFHEDRPGHLRCNSCNAGYSTQDCCAQARAEERARVLRVIDLDVEFYGEDGRLDYEERRLVIGVLRSLRRDVERGDDKEGGGG